MLFVLLLSVYCHIPYDRPFYQAVAEGILLVVNVDILEREIGEVVLVGRSYIEEVAAIHLDIPHHDIVASRLWHVVALLGLEELSPRADDKERACLACEAVDGDILIMLRCVGTHLEPQHPVGIIGMTVPDDDVMVADAL